MSLKDWERDVLNRQRNIVFPDTNLNLGRFYRNVASGKAVFSVGQKVSLLLVLAFFIVVHAVDFAGQISFVISQRAQIREWSVWPSMSSFIWLVFWIFLAVNGLLPPQPAVRRVRRGYRRSGKA
jgi:hypothetical protein